MPDNLNNLMEIMNNYNQTVAKDKQKSEANKEKIQKEIIQIISKEINTESNSPRLQKYLEETTINKLDFLHRSLEFTRGNNQDGNLTPERFAFLNEETKEILSFYNINTEFQLFDLIIDCFYKKLKHPLLSDSQFLKYWHQFHTLAYLDEFFKDISNCLAYQGSFTTYNYVKRYLKETLTEDNQEPNETLIYKNYSSKLEIVSKNLIPIANEILVLRNSIPNSRLSICNHGLKKTANKKINSPITFDQKVFINSIAFGTTLEKLEANNYEDAKQLLYLPHQKIIK